MDTNEHESYSLMWTSILFKLDDSKCQGINHEKIERHENTGHLRIVNMDEFYSQVGSSSPAAIFFFVFFVVR
jgi:hypothetical protein